MIVDEFSYIVPATQGTTPAPTNARPGEVYIIIPVPATTIAVERRPSERFWLNEFPTIEVSADKRFTSSPVPFVSNHEHSCVVILL